MLVSANRRKSIPSLKLTKQHSIFTHAEHRKTVLREHFFCIKRYTKLKVLFHYSAIPTSLLTKQYTIVLYGRGTEMEQELFL